MRTQLHHWWQDMRSNFWFVPSLIVLGAVGLATVLIAVAGVVFSMTIVALALTSSQYTSRVLRTFYTQPHQPGSARRVRRHIRLLPGGAPDHPGGGGRSVHKCNGSPHWLNAPSSPRTTRHGLGAAWRVCAPHSKRSKFDAQGRTAGGSQRHIIQTGAREKATAIRCAGRALCCDEA